VKHQPGPVGDRSRRLTPGSRLVRVVGLLAILVVGVELFLFVRSLRRTHAEETRAGDPMPPPAAVAPVGASSSRPQRDPAPPVAPSPAAAPGAHDFDGGDEAGRPTTVTAALRRRDLLVAAHNQQAIQESDERVFDQLGLPEQQRVAIRLLSERQAKQRQDLVAAERDDLTPEEQGGASIAIGDRIARERQAGLKDILGAAGAQSFLISESAQIRRLQRRYRMQWAQELDEQAPMPPGAPVRAH
jgi:hypothetical protein